MGFTVGAPILSLKPKQEKRKNRSGDLRKILDEMYDRKGVDKDIDPNRRHLDRYLGRFKNADEAYNFYMYRFNNHKVIVKGKNGKVYERKPRENTTVAGNLILKPTAEEVNKLSYEDQQRLANDLIDIGVKVLGVHGLIVDGVVVHNDEEGAHPHFVFHDNDFKMADKLGVKLYGDLNREVPKYLRSKGWECDDLRNYDVEKTKNMTKEEKEEYTREFRKGKKYNGLSSQEYKKQQNKEKAEELERLQKQLEEEKRKNQEERRRNLEELGRKQKLALKKEKDAEEAELKAKSYIATMESNAKKFDEVETNLMLINELKRRPSSNKHGKSAYDDWVDGINKAKKQANYKTWTERASNLRNEFENDDKEIS